jgi:hypothetical protein
MVNDNKIKFKAPQDVVLDLPQERITGDILKGRGPRRGNLESLLRYWRPIMKQPGGFRRCRVILANHPELYPLERICAWLHHETTGLWPNEGCHHPGMKNCKNKLKKNNWSDADFGNRLGRGGKIPGNLERSIGKSKPLGKSIQQETFLTNFYATGTDEIVSDTKAYKELSNFVADNTDFVNWLRDSQNWEHEGQDENGQVSVVPFRSKYDNDCCGGLIERK